MEKIQPYYIYMVRCSDQSIYTGITTEIKRRIQEHFQQSNACAKYTLRHPVIRIESVWKTQNRSLASKLEFRIKKLTKKQKELIIEKKSNFRILLGEYLEPSDFKRLTKKDLLKINKEACTFLKNEIQ